jgi:hypothetical protein
VSIYVRKPVDHLVTTSTHRTCRTQAADTLYYAPAGRYDSADRGRSIIRVIATLDSVASLLAS